MAVDKPVAVPQKKITSRDVPNAAYGLFLGGDQIAPINSIVAGKDAELDPSGYLIPRRKLDPFLPDTVEVTYQKFPVIWNGVIYYFTADAGKIKFAQQGDTSWSNCSGTNSITTNNGGFPVFLRVLNKVLLLNGTNGDKLAYADLETPGFPVVKFTPVADPTAAMTAAGLTAGALSIYYAYSYEGTVGETLLSPILTIPLNIARDQWQTQTTPIKNTLTFHDTPPAGAQFRNLYIAIAATGGVISTDDMLQMATGLDLSNTTFVDDGSLSINLGNVPPAVNSTGGPRVDHGIVEEGNPILWGDWDEPYNIWIGGGGLNALSFTISNNGYKAQPELGTNFFPSSVIGFRNGQGIPSLTVLFSNTEGLAKQAVLEQQNVNYGNQTFTVWGLTEQHYGSAGVSAPNSPINYNGKLLFFSSDGIMSMDTQINRLNVMGVNNISTLKLHDYIKQIKTSAMPAIVGAGWNDKYMWLVPNAGFDTPQQILVYDNANDKTAYYTMDIPAQWIGVVTPKNDPAFVYISQGKSTYKLVEGSSTYDTKGGVSVPFSTGATGAMIGMGDSAAHNEWQANVQVMFYVMGLIGKMTIGVTYRGKGGLPKTKTKEISGPDFVPSGAGGWGDMGWSYGQQPGPRWAGGPKIDSSSGSSVVSKDVRAAIQIDDNFNEAQWFYYTPVGFNNYKIKAISYEGIALGVRPDLA